MYRYRYMNGCCPVPCLIRIFLIIWANNLQRHVLPMSYEMSRAGYVRSH